MRLRSNPLPRRLTDIGCFLLCVIFIPMTFWFELYVVMPEFHGINDGWYAFHYLGGVFLVCNIIGNMLTCMIVDTSIKPEILIPPRDAAYRKHWHYCYACETQVPPRSWHCDICKTCILKRDHHCLFTGCCVGHHNYRYFMYFLLYLTIGAGYATFNNIRYFWWLHGDEYANAVTAFKMVFPMMMFMTDFTFENLYLLIFMLNVIAFAYALVLIFYHVPVLLHGAVAFENDASKYDMGLRFNLEMVLGTHLYWTWLSPLVLSPLPHDGIHWETILIASTKSR